MPTRSDPARVRPSRRTRRRRHLLVVATAVVVVLGVASLPFVVPPSPTVDRTDVAVVLDGGDGERIRRALELVQAGATDTLAIAEGDRGDPVGSDRLCDGTATLTVVCFRPDPISTAGEARALGALADRHGWEHVTVVTSTYHALRSGIAFRQCVDGRVVVVPAGFGEQGLAGRARSVLREMIAVPVMLTLQRAC
jgi:hypothetical protein